MKGHRTEKCSTYVYLYAAEYIVKWCKLYLSWDGQTQQLLQLANFLLSMQIDEYDVVQLVQSVN